MPLFMTSTGKEKKNRTVAYVRTRFIFGSTFCNLIPCNYITIFFGAADHTPQSVGLLWMSDQHVAKTSIWQHTTLRTDRHLCPRQDTHRTTHNLSRQVAAGLCLRPCGHWDYLLQYLQQQTVQTILQYVQLVKPNNKNSVTRNEQSICHTQSMKWSAVDYQLW